MTAERKIEIDAERLELSAWIEYLREVALVSSPSNAAAYREHDIFLCDYLLGLGGLQ